MKNGRWRLGMGHVFSLVFLAAALMACSDDTNSQPPLDGSREMASRDLGPTLDSVAADSGVDAPAADATADGSSADGTYDTVAPDSTHDTVSADTTQDTVAHDSTHDTVAHDTTHDTVAHDSTHDTLAPDSTHDTVAHDSTHDTVAHDSTYDTYSPPNCPTEMVAVSGMQVCIDRYEASHSDATSTVPGTSSTVSSRAGVLPWRNLTWAQADAACVGVGKRLCTVEEWTAACGGPSNFSYPYGNVYQVDFCVGQESVADGTFDGLQSTGAATDCEGGVTGLFDMSGNVGEWTATSFTVNGGGHFVKGGHVNTNQTGMSCSYEVYGTNDLARPWRGFRCCSTP